MNQNQVGWHFKCDTAGQVRDGSRGGGNPFMAPQSGIEGVKPFPRSKLVVDDSSIGENVPINKNHQAVVSVQKIPLDSLQEFNHVDRRPHHSMIFFRRLTWIPPPPPHPNRQNLGLGLAGAASQSTDRIHPRAK